MQIALLLIVSAFYLAYLVKMLLLRRQGVRGGILGKGEKPAGARRIERCMKAVTYAGAAIQFASVLFPAYLRPLFVSVPLQWVGVGLAAAGVGFFLAAVLVMRNNWRAGFARQQNTELVTGGIYRISRNPAFVGFDLLYVGCALACPNPLNLAVTVAAVALFHLQILGEERFLLEAFGRDYARYKESVRRYL